MTLPAAAPPALVARGLADPPEVGGRGRVSRQELVEASCQLLSNPAQPLAEPSTRRGPVSALFADMAPDPLADCAGSGFCRLSRKVREAGLPEAIGICPVLLVPFAEELDRLEDRKDLCIEDFLVRA